ncbi:hypothetical protein IFM89_020300 [Coptis chinensis]|uniref:Uncharacterized protein n=1 Tax=Coptis chinensis TaxID=261450 RepID=A0A835HIT4_9MAGN|nr:hypothetical protein IFM89_020300 [Coptis chinensis]
MSRSGSSGGGHSSLGYLFGSDEPTMPHPVMKPPVTKPPWGDDNTTKKAPQSQYPRLVVEDFCHCLARDGPERMAGRLS